MKLRSLAILLIILVSLLPAFYLNKAVKTKLSPKKSIGRLLLYMFSSFTLIFIYVFLLVWAISHLFPLH